MHYGTLFLLIFLITGCSTTPVTHSRSTSAPFDHSLILKQPDSVPAKLYQHYQQWKGTPYQLGGLSKTGIDCSGYVMLAYQDQFAYQLPRTTEYQAKTGHNVKRHQLAAGDLIFFKTAYKVRHVGIYLGNQQFIHASSSRGVMISGLNDYYWKNKFWQARRIQFN
jgi:lipoprotein Spr